MWLISWNMATYVEIRYNICVIFTQLFRKFNPTLLICLIWGAVNYLWRSLRRRLYTQHNNTLKQGKSEGFDSCDRSSNLTQIGFKSSIFSPCDLEIWRMTFKNNRAPLLCYFKLCASFQCHRLIQTGVTVRKRLIWVKIDDFCSRMTLKFDVWPW